jgi:hypothetical protein
MCSACNLPTSLIVLLGKNQLVRARLATVSRAKLPAKIISFSTFSHVRCKEMTCATHGNGTCTTTQHPPWPLRPAHARLVHSSSNTTCSGLTPPYATTLRRTPAHPGLSGPCTATARLYAPPAHAHIPPPPDSCPNRRYLSLKVTPLHSKLTGTHPTFPPCSHHHCAPPAVLCNHTAECQELSSFTSTETRQLPLAETPVPPLNGTAPYSDTGTVWQPVSRNGFSTAVDMWAFLKRMPA